MRGLYTYQVPGSFRIEDRLLSAVARERNHFEESEMLALIGGSGFTGNDVIEDCEEIEITTPWGGSERTACLRTPRRKVDRLPASSRREA